MLTVVTPAESHDLVSLDAVKAALGITGPNEDNSLPPLIGAASAAITGECNRGSFISETIEESLVIYGPNIVLLKRYPVTEVIQVTHCGAVVDPSMYEIDGVSGTLIRLDRSGGVDFWNSGRIVVRYIAGYEPDAVPPDLVQATIMLVQQYRSQASRDPMLRVDEMSGVEHLEFFPTTAAGLPAPVQALIARHRKPAGA